MTCWNRQWSQNVSYKKIIILKESDEMNDMNLFQQFIAYFQENGGYVFAQFVRHFLISIYGVLFAAIVGIPLESGFLKRCVWPIG